jgi:hypothetical protein
MIASLSLLLWACSTSHGAPQLDPTPSRPLSGPDYVTFAPHHDGILLRQAVAAPGQADVIYLHESATIHYDSRTQRVDIALRNGVVLHGRMDWIAFECADGGPCISLHGAWKAGDRTIRLNGEIHGPGPSAGDYSIRLIVEDNLGTQTVLADSTAGQRQWTTEGVPGALLQSNRPWIADLLCSILSLFGGSCPCQPSCQEVCCPEWWECLLFGPQQCGCPGSGTQCHSDCEPCGDGG